MTPVFLTRALQPSHSDLLCLYAQCALRTCSLVSAARGGGLTLNMAVNKPAVFYPVSCVHASERGVCLFIFISF